MEIVNNQQPTENVALETIENQYWVNMYNALERLEMNEDFKSVITDGYFNKKAVDGVSLLATDYVKSNGLRAEVMESLIAISQLQDYFATIKNLGGIPPEEDED